MTTPTQRRVAGQIATFLRDHSGEYTPDTVVEAEAILKEALAALDPDLEPLAGVDIGNYQMVGVQGDGIVVGMPNRAILNKDDALVHAAWIVTLADPLQERFPQIERMVRNL